MAEFYGFIYDLSVNLFFFKPIFVSSFLFKKVLLTIDLLFYLSCSSLSSELELF
jgi:hypothetical protein